MKFYKSMLRIYEFLLLNMGKNMIIEDVINETGVGRTSGFEAIEHLVNIGIIVEKKNGRQREIFLRLDRYSLSLKLFLDSFKFKELDEDIKLAVNMFVEHLRNISGVNALWLFGSVINTKSYNDIDMMLICKSIDKNKILAVRNKVELISDKTINVHFLESVSIEKFASSLCILGFDYSVDSIFKNKPNDGRENFIEAAEWLDLYKKEKNGFQNLLVNLSFAYCYSENIFPKTKEEAKSLLLKRYSNLNKSNLKGVIREIGEKIFR